MSQRLLAWYDINARKLAWRVGPDAWRAGQRADPYAVWMSEIMLQQTTVAAVDKYFRRFTTLWPDVHALASAKDADVMGEWAGLGYYARARNLLKCARVVSGEWGGVFPGTRAGLQALPGIGPYTAAAISAIAYDRPETVVDGNVERVMARHFAVQTPLPKAKKDLTDLAGAETPEHRPGCYAQAVMDLGATICTPRNPACGICPLSKTCLGRARGIAAELPRKTPKKPKPTRRGIAYLARRDDGAWLLEDRPARGLLGGMLGWPTEGWDGTDDGAPMPANWQDVGVEVTHTFTHFHLRLQVLATQVPQGANPARGNFRALRPADLPTLMRKAFDASQRYFDQSEPDTLG
ncbi:A/G-specific adenine glycosylase [Actibacterium mucosum]|uniref:A/G-specific adenine glycosylase n=1 Tax=Actibacterium mucosum TaxID=1087332 RepID=UPI001F41907D|nr:A/G-specific adenine glycosylase [Actibacterium mucosum]